MAGLSGCANMNETQRDTGMGAAIGAVAGGLIGAATAGGNKGKSAATGAAIGAALGAGGGYLWSQNMQKQRAEMEQATAGTGIGISQTTDNQLKVDIPADVSFDVGRYAIKPNMRPVLDRLASTLNQHPVTTVTIIGHTDSTGSDAVNDPLSVNRAAATRDYLVQRGVSAQRIAVDGRGSRQPVADNTTAAGRAMNRRVEIFIAEAAPQQ
ncbi:MAG: OmpA family protein [Thauera sp.]|nr:OmpA family protein [Thauera sp.]